MTTYDLRFGCKNRVGFSPWSSGQQVMIKSWINWIWNKMCVQVTMPKRGKPEPPLLNYGGMGGLLGESGILEWDTSEQYHLSWQLPEDNGLPIDMFLLRYFPVSWSHNLTTWSISWNTIYHFDHALPFGGIIRIFDCFMSGATRGVWGESQQLEADWECDDWGDPRAGHHPPPHQAALLWHLRQDHPPGPQRIRILLRISPGH